MKLQHLFLRGNYREEIFYDTVDMINAWNRFWISAYKTGTKVMALELLGNHFHSVNSISDEEVERCELIDKPLNTKFMHYLRMSLSLYFNYRYDLHGSLGSRRYGHGNVICPEEDGGRDARDAIRYVLRNVTHHGITDRYQEWQFSTFRFVFKYAEEIEKQAIYTMDTLPSNLRSAYFPTRKLPSTWKVLSNGMLIPPPEVFDREKVEELFSSMEVYLDFCDTPTRRESEGEANERQLGKTTKKVTCTVNDHHIISYISTLSDCPVPNMGKKEKRKILIKVKAQFPASTLGQLSRIFHTPPSTIQYWIEKFS